MPRCRGTKAVELHGSCILLRCATGKARPVWSKTSDCRTLTDRPELNQLALSTTPESRFCARWSACRRWHGPDIERGTQGIEDRQYACG